MKRRDFLKKSAMTSAYDYAIFKNGWWELSENLQNMRYMIEIKYRLLRK